MPSTMEEMMDGIAELPDDIPAPDGLSPGDVAIPKHSDALARIIDKDLDSLRGAACAVLRNLAYYASFDVTQRKAKLYTCWPDRWSLAEDTGLDPSTISEAIALLEGELGYITVTRKKGHANTYLLDAAKICADASRDRKLRRKNRTKHIKKAAERQARRRSKKTKMNAEDAEELDRVLGPVQTQAEPAESAPAPVTSTPPEVEDPEIDPAIKLRDEKAHHLVSRICKAVRREDSADARTVMREVMWDAAKDPDGNVYPDDLATAIDLVSAGVERALTDPFWLPKLTSKKFDCPVKAFAHHFTNGLGEQTRLAFIKPVKGTDPVKQAAEEPDDDGYVEPDDDFPEDPALPEPNYDYPDND